MQRPWDSIRTTLRTPELIGSLLTSSSHSGELNKFHDVLNEIRNKSQQLAEIRKQAMQGNNEIIKAGFN